MTDVLLLVLLCLLGASLGVLTDMTVFRSHRRLTRYRTLLDVALGVIGTLMAIVLAPMIGYSLDRPFFEWAVVHILFVVCAVVVLLSIADLLGQPADTP